MNNQEIARIKQELRKKDHTLCFHNTYNIRDWRTGEWAIRFWFDMPLSVCSPITFSFRVEKELLIKSKSLSCQGGFYAIPLKDYKKDGINEKLLERKIKICYLSLLEFDPKDVIYRETGELHEVCLSRANLILTCPSLDFLKNIKEAEECFREDKKRRYWLQKKDEWMNKGK